MPETIDPTKPTPREDLVRALRARSGKVLWAGVYRAGDSQLMGLYSEKPTGSYTGSGGGYPALKNKQLLIGVLDVTPHETSQFDLKRPYWIQGLARLELDGTFDINDPVRSWSRQLQGGRQPGDDE